MSRPRKYAFQDAAIIVAAFDAVAVALFYLGNRWWRGVDDALADLGGDDDDHVAGACLGGKR